MMQAETIAAISTPLGEGGIGIVRMSGPRSIKIAEGIFSPAHPISLSQVESHTIHYGFIVDKGRRIDEVLVSVMRAPRTYTREDIVEINCHGGIVALQTVLDLVLARGARLADGGEFTRRAFLNGRISLDQATAVLDVVRAKTKLGLETAIDQLGGRFSKEMAEIRRTLASLLAGIEVEIDFPAVEGRGLNTVLSALQELRGRLEQLIELGEKGRIVQEGLTVAIVGRPNVGKSTLLNSFLAEERAIVTPIPGTTRDTVEELMTIGGVPVRVIDTAGLCAPTGPVEAAGVKRSREAIKRADLVLLMLDRGSPLTPEDESLIEQEMGRPAVLVLNKIDLPDMMGEVPHGDWGARYDISAKNGSGIDRLRAGILDLLLEGRLPVRGGVLLLDAWERGQLRRTRERVDEAILAIERELPSDMVAEELRLAYRIAGELQGIDTSEDILDQIFSDFCVGK
jgi:tRNA modification GTPase